MELIKLTFSGDIMLPSEILNNYKIKDENYNFDNMFSEIKEYLSKSDYVIGNLETPITSNNSEVKREQYKFTSPIEFAKSVKDAGFDFVTTANNHCLDNSIQGIEKTVKSLNKVGLQNTGIFYDEEKPSIINIKNIKIAILSYTYGTNAFFNNVYLNKKEKVKINLLQEQELNNKIIRTLYKSKNIIIKIIRKILKKLKLFQLHKPIYERNEKSHLNKRKIIQEIKNVRKNGADYIIMCMHEGGQYNSKPIARTVKNAEFMIKNGVDIVIGNHEHRIHKVITDKKQIITYSLGNFIGSEGVFENIHNAMSEYSILINIYLCKDNIKYSTFTIIKCIKDENKNEKGIKVKLLYDLINECDNEKEKVKLLKDNNKIIKIVTGKDIDIKDIKKEYKI